jgi:zinc protease
MKFRPAGLAFASFLSFCLLLVSSGAWAAANAQEFKLANGMRIIVQEDRRAPTVAHMVWYRAGSVDEQNGTTGVAHVLEHMMFKGTAKLKPGEFSEKVAALGGRDNAFTGKDYTAYHQQVEKSRLEQVMALERGIVAGVAAAAASAACSTASALSASRPMKNVARVAVT